MVRCGGCRAVIRLETMTQPDVADLCEAGSYHHIAITLKSIAPSSQGSECEDKFAVTEPA